MKIETPIIKVEFTPRELLLMTYCIDELLYITNEMDLKRGFGLNKQEECNRLLSDLDESISILNLDKNVLN